jgi:hypothetical protein
VSLALSTYLTPQAAATLSFILAFGSSMIVRGLLMGYDAGNPFTSWLFKLINAALPQFSLFDLGGRAANSGWAPVSLGVMLFLVSYMAIYCSGMIALSWAKFRRQAI